MWPKSLILPLSFGFLCTVQGCTEQNSSPAMVEKVASPAFSHPDLGNVRNAESASHTPSNTTSLSLPSEVLNVLSCFKNGDVLEVSGPFGYSGVGEVQREQDRVFRMLLRMPQQRVLFKSVPRVHIDFSLTSCDEPHRVLGDVSVNQSIDNSVQFTSQTREGSDAVTLQPEHTLATTRLDSVSIRPRRNNEVSIAIDRNGEKNELLVRIVDR